jgi:histone H3/H4
MCYFSVDETEGRKEEREGEEVMAKGGLIVRNNIKKVVRVLDKDHDVPNVAEEVGMALERKVEEILIEGIKRAKENGRRTLQARDL